MGSKTVNNNEKIDNLCDNAIVGLFIGLFIIMPFALGGTENWAIPVTGIITSIALALWGIRLWLNNSHRIFSTPAVWIIIAITAYAFIEYLRSPIEWNARSDTFLVLQYVSIFFLFINNLRKRKHSGILLISIITIGTLISLYAIAQFITGSTHILWGQQPEVYAHRASGTFLCPNHLAGFLEMIVPIALALTISGRIGNIQRILLGFATIAMLLGIGVTISRAGYLVTAISIIAVLLVLVRKRRYRIPSIAAAAILAITAISFLLANPIKDIRNDEILTKTQLQEGRGAIYTASLKLAEQKPILGTGSGTYSSMIHRYLTPKTQIDPVYAHSDYLQILIEWGAIGLALIITLLVFVVLGEIKTWKHLQPQDNALVLKDSTRSALFLGAMGGFLAITLHSIADFNMRIPLNALLATILLAYITSSLRYGTKKCWLKQTTANRIAAGILILLTIGLLTWNSLNILHINSLLKTATLPSTPLDTKIQTFNKIAKIAPTDWIDARTEARTLLAAAATEQSPKQKNALYLHALNAFNRAEKANSYHFTLSGGKCMTYTWLNRDDEALESGKKMMQQNPNGFDSASVFGWSALLRGDYDQAVEYLERSIHLKNEGNNFAKEWYEIAIQRQNEKKRYE